MNLGEEQLQGAKTRPEIACSHPIASFQPILMRNRFTGSDVANPQIIATCIFEAGPRILPTEDEDVSAAVAAAFRESGMVVRESFGAIESFEKTPSGVRMVFSKDGTRNSAEAPLAVVAIGWVADTTGLNLAAAGVETNPRGYVRVDEYLRTSAPNIFAAGDITGRLMLVPQAIHDGFVAATNAVRGPAMTLGDQVSPIGSFTDPEYAQVGLSEAKARETHDVVVVVVPFDETARTIIDGRTIGVCKLIADRATGKILGCHVVGDRAVEIVQVVTIRHGRRSGGKRHCQNSTVVPHLYRDCRASSIPCRPPDLPRVQQAGGRTKPEIHSPNGRLVI